MYRLDTQPTYDPEELLFRWKVLAAAEPGLQVRDAAVLLEVSEAELVATRCGQSVSRLEGPWDRLIRALPDLGQVMALTRNQHVVHEKVGQYTRMRSHSGTGLILGADIDLRVFLQHWHLGFAVGDHHAQGKRFSLQFFDRDGTAVHKVYLRDPDRLSRFYGLVERHRHDDQTPAQAVHPHRPTKPDKADAQINQPALREAWMNMADVHEFKDILAEHRVDRLQALRLAGPDLARPLSNDATQRALSQCAKTNLPVMVFVASRGVVQIHTGPVQLAVRTKGWFNILDPRFNLHLKENAVASAWAVTKPTRNGPITSIEAYDSEHQQIACLFGQRDPGGPERTAWRQLVDSIPLPRQTP